jgi:membrane protein
LAPKAESVLSVSILITLWSAARALNALQRALNAAYEVRGRKSPLTSIGISLFFTFGLSIAVVVMLLLPNMGVAFLQLIGRFITIRPIYIRIFEYSRWVTVIVVPLLILSALYQHLPNIQLTFREVIPGTIFAYFGWFLVSFSVSYFIQNFSNISIVYGSLAAVVILMVWFYFTGMILMLGGEINSINKAYSIIQSESKGQ